MTWLQNHTMLVEVNAIMSKKLKGIIFALVIIVVIGLAIIIFIPEVSILLGLAFRRVIQVLSIVFVERWREWLIIIALFVAIFLIIFFIAPVLKFFFGRLGICISLGMLSTRKNIRVKNIQHVLCLTKAFDAKKCIEITTPDQVYNIHFLSIIFSSRRAVFFDSSKYFIAFASPSKLSAYGATLVDGESWFDLSAKVISGHSLDTIRGKSLPCFNPNSAVKHIVIVHSKTTDIYIVRCSKTERAYNGSRTESGLYYYNYSSLKKHLKENF